VIGANNRARAAAKMSGARTLTLPHHRQCRRDGSPTIMTVSLHLNLLI
jgi:hypothetical protein